MNGRVTPTADPAVNGQVVATPARHSLFWRWVAALEVALAAAAVLLDLLIPSLVLVALAAVSLVVRRQGLSSLGLNRWVTRLLVGKMFVFAAAWSLLHLAVTMPIANHVSGQRADVSQFRDLEGNLGLLVAYLLLAWVLAAFAEELAFRGFLLTRMREAFGHGRSSLVAAALLSSLLFSFLHTEQGMVGVTVVLVDALAYTFLRVHYGTLWAAVLAHGFIDSIGFVTFFLVGPVYGLW